MARSSIPREDGRTSRHACCTTAVRDHGHPHPRPAARRALLRLLAPDSYASLTGLKRVKETEITEAARRYGIQEPALFSISFFGLRERAPFSPEKLTLQSRGRFFRPIGFVPMSPGWGERQVAQRGSEFAIVLYEPGMSLFDEDLVVAYQGFSTRAWGSIAKVLEQERSAVLSRAAAARKQ